MTDLERRRAAALAGHLGSVDEARAALSDPIPQVRATALGSLDRCAALTDADLADALADSSPLVRRRAVELAAPRQSVEIVALLADSDAAVAEMTAWACGERAPTDDAVDRLCRMARDHSDPLVREAAVAALGSLQHERGLPAILAALSDKPAIRRRAVIALTPFDGPEVNAAFETAKSDRDWQVRQLAEEFAP